MGWKSDNATATDESTRIVAKCNTLDEPPMHLQTVECDYIELTVAHRKGT